jgi:hypothetical protein
MDVAAADLDHEEHLHPLEGDGAVDREEVARQHRRCLGAQELRPGGVYFADRRGRYPLPLEHAPDRGGTDMVAEFEQLALDPLVSPVGILSGQLGDRSTIASSIGGGPVR